ncbi:MAG: signal peptidase I [bacterium]|nr:signal peptidase I [bacterium]
MDEQKTENAPKKESSLKEFVKFFVVAALIVVPLRLWVAQPFIVRGASMEPTYENGEYLVVDEFSYHFRSPQRGEVIVFRFPEDTSKIFIKRIIGLPGEKVEILDNQIHIYNKDFTNGFLLKESYIGEFNAMITADMAIILNSDEYFVLGDNRPASSDSRLWGSLKQNLIIGRTWLRLFPFNRISVFP